MKLYAVYSKFCLPGIPLLNNELSSISSILEKINTNKLEIV